jgi:hypothetical protein
MFVTYHLRIRETEFCVLAYPAVWWRSVELQSGSVTFGFGGMVQGKHEVLREELVPVPLCPPQISAWTDPVVIAHYVKCSY